MLLSLKRTLVVIAWSVSETDHGDGGEGRSGQAGTVSARRTEPTVPPRSWQWETKKGPPEIIQIPLLGTQNCLVSCELRTVSKPIQDGVLLLVAITMRGRLPSLRPFFWLEGLRPPCKIN